MTAHHPRNIPADPHSTLDALRCRAKAAETAASDRGADLLQLATEIRELALWIFDITDDAYSSLPSWQSRIGDIADRLTTAADDLNRTGRIGAATAATSSPTTARCLGRPQEDQTAGPVTLDPLRVRADTADGLTAARAASVTELANGIAELCERIAAFRTEAHNTTPGWQQRALATMVLVHDRADALYRSSQGYAAAQPTDLAYRDLAGDLHRHDWVPVPDRELDGTLLPVPITELGVTRAGYRRGWRRGGQSLIVWMTSPWSISHATTSGWGRLYDVREIRTVITSRPRTTLHGDDGTPLTPILEHARVEFGATDDRVSVLLRDHGWSTENTQPCTATGHPTQGGTHTRTVWRRPIQPSYALQVWARGGDQPAQVRYWAGPIPTLARLLDLLNRPL